MVRNSLTVLRGVLLRWFVVLLAVIALTTMQHTAKLVWCVNVSVRVSMCQCICLCMCTCVHRCVHACVYASVRVLR